MSVSDDAAAYLHHHHHHHQDTDSPSPAVPTSKQKRSRPPPAVPFHGIPGSAKLLAANAASAALWRANHDKSK